MLVHRGLVDPPADPILREEILAHRVEPVRKTIERKDKDGRWEKVRVDAVALIAKDEIKKIIGRSPDRSDAFVVAVFDAPPREQRHTWVPASESYYSI
jgi:phage terminase large subunit-like protein